MKSKNQIGGMAVLKKMKSENGSVTVEATISLSAFMFAIVTILTIINICIVQARVSYAINTTAKEISQYSYLYSLTGFNNSQSELYEAGKEDTQDLTQILSDVNTVYNEIENLGQTGNQSTQDIDSILSAWDGVAGSVDTIEAAGSSIEDSISNIASNPKKLLFGIAKLAGSEGFDLVKSRLIAAPLSKVLCQKHLVDTENGDVDAYLKHLGVVPSATGSYIDGLDFSNSTLFPYGSNKITINVSYDVKIIPLLPLDFSFHFNQTAVTHGWLSGEVSFQSAEKYVENDTLWTKSTISERSSLIRNMVIKDLVDDGYKKTSGLTDVQLYKPATNEFVMISSMNPLYSPAGEAPLTLDDLDADALKESIERICGKMKSTTDLVTTVTTKSEKDGQTTKSTNNCSGASNKIVLVIPEDEGLKEKIDEAISTANKRGVTIEVVPSYGNGANQSVMKEGSGE